MLHDSALYEFTIDINGTFSTVKICHNIWFLHEAVSEEDLLITWKSQHRKKTDKKSNGKDTKLNATQ